MTDAILIRPAGRRLLVGIFLFLYFVLALGSAWKLSPTQDEPLHLASGFTYWEKHDYRMQPENGLLGQRWIGLGPLILGNITPVAEDEDWSSGRQWLKSFRFLEDNGHRALVAGRVMIVLAGAVLLLAVYGWSRRLWGDWGGLFSLGLAAFSPTVLAHVSMATSDVFLTLTFFLAAWILMAVLRQPSVLKVALAGVACGAAALSKYTAIILAPYALIVLLLGWWLLKPQKPVRFFAVRLGSLVAAAIVAYAIIWAGYGFRYSAFHPDQNGGAFNQPWDELRTDSGASRAIAFLEAHRLLPEPYLYGAEQAYFYSRSRAAFFMGESSGGGYRLYFPVAFLLKTSPFLLAASLLSLVALPRLWRRFGKSNVEWALAAAAVTVAGGLFLFFCIQSNLNIGHRHMLPVYAFLFVWIGGVVPFLQQFRRAYVPLIAVVLGHSVLATSVFPAYLSYFNFIVGGSKQGYYYFADSSYDWGQEMYVLSQWERLRTLQEGEGEELQYALFAPMHINYYNLTGSVIFQFGASFPAGMVFPPLQPGLVAATATIVSGPYFFTSTMAWSDRDEHYYWLTRSRVAEAVEAGGTDTEAWRAHLLQYPEIPWTDLFQMYSRLRVKRFLSLAREEGELVARPADTIFVWRVSEDLLAKAEMLDEPEIRLELSTLWDLLRRAASSENLEAPLQDRNQ